MANMNLPYLSSYSFVNVQTSNNFLLDGNEILYIEPETFDVTVGDTL